MDGVPYRIGGKSIRSRRYFLKNGCPDYKQCRAAPLDIPRIRIIIQTKGKAQKDGFALRNYQLILFQFFEFTQTLKRSRKITGFTVFLELKNC